MCPSNLTAHNPPLLFMRFSLTFAAVTVAIVTSGVAERINLNAFLLCAFLWVTLVYSPVAHWVEAGRWVSEMGFLDLSQYGERAY